MVTPDQKLPKHEGPQSLPDTLIGNNINVNEAERTSTPHSTKAVDSQTPLILPNGVPKVTLKCFRLSKSENNDQLFVVSRIEFMVDAKPDEIDVKQPNSIPYVTCVLAAIILRSLLDANSQVSGLDLKFSPEALSLRVGRNLKQNFKTGFNRVLLQGVPEDYFVLHNRKLIGFKQNFDTSHFEIVLSEHALGDESRLIEGKDRTQVFKDLIELFRFDEGNPINQGFELSDLVPLPPTEIVTNPTDDTSTELSVMNSPAQDESQPTKAEALEQGNASSTNTEASRGNNHTEPISIEIADKGADSHSAATDLEATAAEAPTEESASITAQPALAEEPKPSNEDDQNQNVDPIALALEVHSSAYSEVDSNTTLDKRVAAQQSTPHNTAPWFKNRMLLLLAVLMLLALITLVYSFSQNTHSSREFVLPLKQRLLTELDFDANGIAVWFSAAEDDIRYPSSNAQGLVNVPSDPVSFEDKLSVFRDFMALPGNFPRYQPGAHRKYISDAFDVQADVSKFIIEYDGIDCDAFFFIASDNSMDLVHNLTTDVSVFLKQPLIPGKTYRIIAIVIPNGRYLENPPLSLRFVHTP